MKYRKYRKEVKSALKKHDETLDLDALTDNEDTSMVEQWVEEFFEEGVSPQTAATGIAMSLSFNHSN